MLPHQLRLKNFLSYQELFLDFTGLHIAGIWGTNGAGKSALLESMAWALWGYSRVSNEDHLIYFGANEVKVDFVFSFGEDRFRVLRSRTKGGSPNLEWQIYTGDRWRSLTAKTVKQTQQLIIDTLKMDYETFVNSAYLRQGKADEFMLKKPPERKQVLAEILNLSSYEILAERAKELAKTCKGSALILQQQIQQLEKQCTDLEQLLPELPKLEQQKQELLQAENRDRTLYQTVQKLQHEHQWRQQQYQKLTADLEQLQQNISQIQQQLANLQAILSEEKNITRAYEHYQQISQQEQQLREKLPRYQQLQERYQYLVNFVDKQKQELQMYLRQYQAQLEQFQKQQQDLQPILSKADDIQAGLEKLQRARSHLQKLEQLHSQASPLLQRKQVLLLELETAKTKLSSQIEALSKQQQSYQNQAQKIQSLQHQSQAIAEQINILRKKEVYQKRVYEKGLERRDYLERIKAKLEECQKRQQELDLQTQALQAGEISVCPVCKRPLDQHHLENLHAQAEIAYRELQAEIWVLKEQKAVTECEIEVLRSEYRQLQAELQQLPKFLEQSGAITAELANYQTNRNQQQEFADQLQILQRQLATNQFALDIQQELSLLEQSLSQINYDEKDLALARGECDRWRWAEIKQAELKNAQQQLQKMQQKMQELESSIQQITDRLNHDYIAPPQQQELQQIYKAIQKLGYDPHLHQQLQTQLQQLTPALLRYQDLRHAQTQQPLLQKQLQNWQSHAEHLQKQITLLEQHLQKERSQLSQLPTLHTLEQQIHQNRQQLEQLLAQIGSLQQLQKQQAQYQTQLQQLKTQLKQLQYRQQLAEKLQIAYGKNGIQALTIEYILPQIEAEANHILAQLSDRQLTLRFITQKATKKQDKTIDTLDIEVSDLRGTRPYETYSGGEAFRINFAIRLALARILAQRKGCTLQTLIVDESFGSQDRAGCDRLLSALNAIAHEFGCILVVTHMPHLKEAFSTVLEVTKTSQGSQIIRHE
ncbi:MAG: SMC family ATPase [Pseudanabaenaceae cyanobacterium]